MSATIKLQGWIDTGTGRQAATEVEATVQNGVIVAPGGGEAVVVVNNTGVDMARDALVYVSGVTGGVLEVTLADADVADSPAMFYLPAALLTGATGLAYKSGLSVATLNTNAGTVDDPVYLDAATAGNWTLTPPTGADDSVQVVGRVAVKSATVGQIMWALSEHRDVGTNELQDLAVTTGKLAADAVDGTKLADAAVNSEHIAAGAVDGVHLTNAAFGIAHAATLTVDHADASPVEIVAADATHERLFRVVVVATEAAAGGPDIDIGSAGFANSVVDDFGAGAWALGDRCERVVRVEAGGNLRATIAAAGTAGALAIYVDNVTPVIQSTNFAAALLTWLNAIRSYIADAMLTVSTITVSAAPATSFKTTTTTAFKISGITYTKVAEDPIAFTAADTINVGAAVGSYWGIWLVQVTAAGVVSTKPGGGLADQVYADEAAAIAALPAVDAANIQLGYITVEANANVAFTCNTSNLTVAGGAGNCQARTFYDLPAPATLPAVLT